VGNARVPEDVLVDAPALDLTHRLDFLAVLLGFVVLLAVLMEAVMALDLRLFRERVRRSPFLQLLDEPRARLFAVLPFGVLLRPPAAPVPWHLTVLIGWLTATTGASARPAASAAFRGRVESREHP
jgi:hypothetical protein